MLPITLMSDKGKNSPVKPRQAAPDTDMHDESGVHTTSIHDDPKAQSLLDELKQLGYDSSDIMDALNKRDQDSRHQRQDGKLGAIGHPDCNRCWNCSARERALNQFQ